MPDETPDVKAQKLAAARKKLKEYQQRNNNNIDEHSSTVSIASNLSERSEYELNASNTVEVQQHPVEHTTTAPVELAAYFGQQSFPLLEPAEISGPHNGQGDTNLQTIQVLIGEKAQLNTELTKCRHLCRERELELEELRTEHGQTQQRHEQVQQRCQDQQRSVEQQRNQNAELQHKLALAQAQNDDKTVHLGELEAQLKQLSERRDDLQQMYSSKCNELDMAQLRLRQLSDESNVNADNRVETLTQTQYMYEQQIRDLQQMVSQLTQDKDQAAIQYQNYVANLNERNLELSEECTNLKERERQLVDHVSGLERDIQKNLTLQAQYKDIAGNQIQQPMEDSETATCAELVKLQERISDLEFERHEFQLKIKSQDDQLQTKDDSITQLQEDLHRLQLEQPDQVKLLATMESDKVAASRALSQNVEMKQQLNELEKRFVQLTNEKLELVNKLDAEEFANREIRQQYSSMEQRLQTNEERFKFKDDEMIRLSHENVELQRAQLVLQQQLDRMQHYDAKAYHSLELKATPSTEIEINAAEGAIEAHEHDQFHHSHDNHSGENQYHHYLAEHTCDELSSNSKALTLPTADAVEKLQSRFTSLISQVADLTEEKQSLEHLVLQLQSETETIGEYIALYQTQRRMLKQREYEKATQMRLLKAEREQLREKIDVLNKLVASLGLAAHLPTVQLEPQTDSNATTDHHLLPSSTDDKKPSGNSQQILHQIQDIITEIKVSAEETPTTLSNAGQSGHAVDHLNCCLGKFEIV